MELTGKRHLMTRAVHVLLWSAFMWFLLMLTRTPLFGQPLR